MNYLIYQNEYIQYTFFKRAFFSNFANNQLHIDKIFYNLYKNRVHFFNKKISKYIKYNKC